jgi:hypothetical protein
LYRNEQSFNIIFASAMRRDYSINPSLTGIKPGVIWSYENPSKLLTFDDNHPLDVSSNKCNSSSFCVWYISPLWEFNDTDNTQYALLGEVDKWTVVSRQRFTSIVINTENTQTIISLEGSLAGIVQLSLYHSVMKIVSLKCFLSPTTGQARLVITPSRIVCSGADNE